MQKRLPIPVIIVLLFSSLLGSAQKQQARASSLLWQIRGKGIAPSYLFGTFHMLCKDDFSMTDSLKKKFATTKQLYSEIKMDDPAMQMKIMKAMSMKDTTLLSLFGSDSAKANEAFKTITGIPMQMLNGFRPFMSMSLLTMKSIDCAEQVQMEGLFVAMAKEAGMPVKGLETLEAQMDLMNSEPIDSQINSLKKTLFNFDSVKISMTKMIATYKKNNADSIYRFIKDNGGSDAFEEKLLVKRNKNWIPVIKKAVTEMPSFFVVGAGHLGGKNGVISLLRKEGYTLTPMKY
ncbi:TraB/GumN family protein [Sediminibacterium ginsengisoli]|uniref:TraB family protein n=1 Tax=Sediminibacterium ginsengisoli TaxID=413434 RepID=A0A1T4R3C7_9BACT|nr:TraB/GumN family protein [Sediminibacterium ginsengisoli]SKA10335.1 hypothetical protein SAMN04488132_11099 [Sediminibacterium ginsengisoli]